MNRPDRAFREIARTLKPGGDDVFTTPTYRGLERSFRRAFIHPDSVEHLQDPEYHGNPVDPRGALATFHYGYDLPEGIHEWSHLNTTVVRFHDPSDRGHRRLHRGLLVLRVVAGSRDGAAWALGDTGRGAARRGGRASKKEGIMRVYGGTRDPRL